MYSLTRIAVILLLFSACNGAFYSSEDDELRLELEMKSEEINTLQDIEAELSATNISGNELVYEFTSSCQHAYTIQKDDSVLFDSREETACATVLTELRLDPQESKTYQISLSSAANDNTLESGMYSLEAFLLNDRSPKVEATFVIE